MLNVQVFTQSQKQDHMKPWNSFPSYMVTFRKGSPYSAVLKDMLDDSKLYWIQSAHGVAAISASTVVQDSDQRKLHV